MAEATAKHCRDSDGDGTAMIIKKEEDYYGHEIYNAKHGNKEENAVNEEHETKVESVTKNEGDNDGNSNGYKKVKVEVQSEQETCNGKKDCDDTITPQSSSSKQPIIKSLTVRFDNGNEIWRMAPSRAQHNNDDDSNGNDTATNFELPPGWIEVNHPEKRSSPNRTRREFHPPHRPGSKGKSETFHSLEDVRRFLDRERKRTASTLINRINSTKSISNNTTAATNNTSISITTTPPPRRSRPRRSTTSSKQEKTPNSSSCNTIHSSTNIPTTPYRLGTEAELQQIMKRNNSLSIAMRNSIIHAAVLARKKDELYGNPNFIGVNGHIYPDLRLAFGKYANMKQCAVCKQRVQGAFYCRLKNMHIDVPDWDYGGTSAGGDGNTKSAECLRGLFLCSVEELEESRGSWTLKGGKGGGDASNRRKRMRGEEDHNQKSVLDTMDDAKNCSLDRFGEDLLYLIASFLPNLQQLVSFCQSSKRSHYLLYKSIHSENLFRGIFLRAFGEEGIIGNFENNLSWKERWAMIRGMRRGLVLKSKKIKGIRIPQSRTNNQRLRQTLGMLHERDEWDAIYYENPEFLEDDSHGVGYFGMEILHLPKPPNAPDNWKPLVALRGDFDGIRILNSIEEAVFEQNSDGDDAKDESGYRVARDDFVSVGDEDDGQVLALIQCDLSLASLNGENICGRPPPCCFIGYASGSVAAVTATLSDEGDKYNFSISASYQAHEAELTALTFVNCSSTLGENEPVLFSADCDGKVYFYPNALNPSRGFSMEDSFMAFVSTNDCPILSLSSTVIHSEHQSYSVLCTGDGGGNIRLWLKSHVDLASLSAPDTVKFRQLQVCKASTHRGSDTHSVTRTLFIHNNLLVTGTNGGDVRIWQIRCVENHTRSLELAEIPKLTLRHELNNIFNGAVEFVATIGDVLLTSGGNDGELIGYDVDTGLKLGSLRCHPGRIMKDRRETKAYSCVVDVVLNGKDGRLITLCRDGMLNQWKFDKYLLGRAFNPNKL